MISFFTLPAPPPQVACDLALYAVTSNENEDMSPAQEKACPEAWLVLACLAGQDKLTADGQAHTVGQGELLLVPCRRLELPGGCRYHAVLLCGELAQRCCKEVSGRLGGRIRPEKNCPVAGTLRRICHSVALGAAADGYWGSAKAYALLMELYAMRPERKGDAAPELVRQALELLRNEYAYLAGVEDLAARLAVSKHHLIRLFSKSEGIPPGRMLTEIRMENAKLLLETGRYHLDTIADMVGFASGNYFCKAFKKATGMTPSEYANSAGRNSSKQVEKLEQIFYL